MEDVEEMEIESDVIDDILKVSNPILCLLMSARALREIHHYQKSTALIIPLQPFQRLIRQIAQDFRTDLKFTRESLACLQTMSEHLLIELFEMTYIFLL